MKKITLLSTTLAFAVLIGNSALAQELPQPSPAAKIEQRVGLTDLTVTYSRPSVKDRDIYGKLVPFDQVWRTGANAATTFETTDAIMIDGKKLDAGKYTVYTTPGKTSWSVMFNKKQEGWGPADYDKSMDAVVVNVTPVKAEHMENVYIGFDQVVNEKAMMVIHWEKMKVHVPITVDVKTKALANIQAALNDNPDAKVYRNAARYTAQSGNFAARGLTWIDKSIEMDNSSWYSYWVKADVEAANGKYKEAVASAKMAIEKGEAKAKKDGGEFSYKGQLMEEITKWESMK